MSSGDLEAVCDLILFPVSLVSGGALGSVTTTVITLEQAKSKAKIGGGVGWGRVAATVGSPVPKRRRASMHWSQTFGVAGLQWPFDVKHQPHDPITCSKTDSKHLQSDAVVEQMLGWCWSSTSLASCPFLPPAVSVNGCHRSHLRPLRANLAAASVRICTPLALVERKIGIRHKLQSCGRRNCVAKPSVNYNSPVSLHLPPSSVDPHVLVADIDFRLNLMLNALQSAVFGQTQTFFSGQ